MVTVTKKTLHLMLLGSDLQNIQEKVDIRRAIIRACPYPLTLEFIFDVSLNEI